MIEGMAQGMPRDFDVEYQLTRLVRRVRARSLRRLGEIHPSLDYTGLVLLLAIDDADGVRAAELAESMGVHKSTVSRTVASLERLGLVERAPHPDDGRAQVLTSSDLATERLKAYREVSHDWLAGLIQGWDPAELATFARSLDRLNDAMEGSP